MLVTLPPFTKRKTHDRRRPPSETRKKRRSPSAQNPSGIVSTERGFSALFFLANSCCLRCCPARCYSGLRSKSRVMSIHAGTCRDNYGANINVVSYVTTLLVAMQRHGWTLAYASYCFICLSSGGTIAVHDEPSGFDARCQARSGEPHVVFSRT